MEPKSVTIDSKVIDDVREVEIEVVRPSNPDGQRIGDSPVPARVVLSRLATNSPTEKLFELMTNGNGSKKLFGGEIVLQDDTNTSTYTFTFKNAFVSAWSLSMDASNAHGEEQIAFSVNEVTLQVGTDTATFKAGRAT
jgi:hypothetical protein